MRFDPAVLANNPRDRRPLLDVLSRALEAADPERAIAAAASREGSTLEIAGTTIDLTRLDRVVVLALGKAASPMAAGLIPLLRDMRVEGVMVGVEGAEPVDGLEQIAGGHPVPDEGSLTGGRRLLQLATGAGPDDLVVVLVSGGGSALAEAPIPGVELDDLIKLNRLLLASGANIEEVNTVRRHLSLLKGGGMAAVAHQARMVTLVISDVVGSPLHAVASGPTVPDPTTTDEALAVLERYRLSDAIPPRVLEVVRRRAQDAKSPRDHAIEVVLDGPKVALAATQAAKERGWTAQVVEKPLIGEAREVGQRLSLSRPEPGLTIYAGETTVTVTGGGRGGRNQELALAAAVALDGHEDLSIATLATDGVDGPTDAAGAIVDGGTVARGHEAGLDPAIHLSRNDSYPFLEATRDLLFTGPTGTNVGDLVIVSRQIDGPG